MCMAKDNDWKQNKTNICFYKYKFTHKSHTKIVNIECWGNDSELIYSVLGPNTDKKTHNFKAQQPLSSPEL